MGRQRSRREFLASSAAAGLGLLAAGRLGAAPFKTTLHKAMIGGANEGAFKKWKAAGFEGCECSQWNVPPDQAKKARDMAEKVGIKIHSVLRGWVNFNSKQESAVDGAIKTVEIALKTAEGYGADAILLVPCRVGGVPMPQPWEFDIAFDERTGHVTRVAKGDNEKFKAYIEAQNWATDSTRKAVQRLIPVAEKAGVKIALENVWNNLWVTPALFAHFIHSFDSPMVGAYFDIGNHVKYAPPETWIPKLGKKLFKVHIKDFKLNADGHGGKFCKIREGSVNWPACRKALDDVGYNGWLTNESGGLSLEELSKRFDLIIAGK